MVKKSIVTHRLSAQGLTAGNFNSAVDVVKHMGAIQSQDPVMSRWAVGIRSGAKDEEVATAINKGEIIRTHVLRPTWHLVAAEDVRWMLALTAHRVQKLYLPMCRRHGIDEKMLARFNKGIEKVLKGNNYLTRGELMQAIDFGNTRDSDIRPTLIMMHAELEGLVCNGPVRGKQITYALIDERVPVTPAKGREDSLSDLAVRYFSSHGPATIKDFAWWSGLTVTDCLAATEIAGNKLTRWDINSRTLYAGTTEPAVTSGSQAHFLPAFDELLISYTDRTDSIATEQQALAFTKNGIFKPVLSIDGLVQGTWKRVVKKTAIEVQLALFNPLSKPLMRQAERAAAALGEHYSADVVLKLV